VSVPFMRLALLCNAFVLTAIAWVGLVGPSTPSKSLLPKKAQQGSAVDLGALEERAALAPSLLPRTLIEGNRGWRVR
jgi:hypothetical protein